jgi:hypothetical protein
MAGMIKSIFGLTTEDVREQQLKQQQAAAQQFAKQTGANMGVASFGTALGAGLGRGLMSRLGFEDPAMAKAQEAEARQTALNEQLAALDPNDPRRQYLLAEALSSMGDTQASLAAYASGRQMEQYQSQLAEQDRMFNLRQSEAEAVSQRAKDTIFAKLLELNSPEEARRIMSEIYGGSYTPAKTTDTSDPSKLGDNKTTSDKKLEQTTTKKPKVKQLTQEEILKQYQESPIGTMFGTGEQRSIKTESGPRLVSEFTGDELLKIREDAARNTIPSIIESMKAFDNLTNEQKNALYEASRKR